jgi:hypothetical protein
MFTAVLDCSSLLSCVPIVFTFCKCLDWGSDCTGNVSNKGFSLLFDPSLPYNPVSKNPRTCFSSCGVM